MACRAYFADAGAPLEVVPLARDDGERWTVRVEAHEADERTRDPGRHGDGALRRVRRARSRGSHARSRPAGCCSSTTTGSPTTRTPPRDYDPGPPSLPAIRRPGVSRSGATTASRAASSVCSGTRRAGRPGHERRELRRARSSPRRDGRRARPSPRRPARGERGRAPARGRRVPHRVRDARADRRRHGDSGEAAGATRPRLRDRYSREHVDGHRSLFLDLVYVKR